MKQQCPSFNHDTAQLMRPGIGQSVHIPCSGWLGIRPRPAFCQGDVVRWQFVKGTLQRHAVEEGSVLLCKWPPFKAREVSGTEQTKQGKAFPHPVTHWRVTPGHPPSPPGPLWQSTLFIVELNSDTHVATRGEVPLITYNYCKHN